MNTRASLAVLVAAAVLAAPMAYATPQNALKIAGQASSLSGAPNVSAPTPVDEGARNPGIMHSYWGAKQSDLKIDCGGGNKFTYQCVESVPSTLLTVAGDRNRSGGAKVAAGAAGVVSGAVLFFPALAIHTFIGLPVFLFSNKN